MKASAPFEALPPELLVGTHHSGRRVAKRILVFLACFATVSGLAPWRQTVVGSGRVVAFAPDQREQGIEATVSGRVERWLVHEGSRVKQGDALVILADNDADLLRRLDEERTAITLRLTAQEARASNLSDRIESLRRSRTAEIGAAEAEVDVARQSVTGAEQALAAATAQAETAALNLKRQLDLEADGLVSRRDLELAQLADRRGQAARASAEAALREARSRMQARKASLQRIGASADASIHAAQASLQDAETGMASTRAQLARLAVGISRQSAQTVRAAVDGTILRVIARRGGEQVSLGEVLAVLVPQTEDRAVELYVDGNDAALIQAGAHVRLQFEGWPAVQFSGWPSVAVGTFGGEVAFVDPADDGRGNFRVLVQPDRAEEAWPSPHYLRQGVRAKGWFLLRKVRIGVEIWRRFNGFPPTTTPTNAPTANAASKAKAS